MFFHMLSNRAESSNSIVSFGSTQPLNVKFSVQSLSPQTDHLEREAHSRHSYANALAPFQSLGSCRELQLVPCSRPRRCAMPAARTDKVGWTYGKASCGSRSAIRAAKVSARPGGKAGTITKKRNSARQRVHFLLLSIRGMHF